MPKSQLINNLYSTEILPALSGSYAHAPCRNPKSQSSKGQQLIEKTVLCQSISHY